MPMRFLVLFSLFLLYSHSVFASNLVKCHLNFHGEKSPEILASWGHKGSNVHEEKFDKFEKNPTMKVGEEKYYSRTRYFLTLYATVEIEGEPIIVEARSAGYSFPLTTQLKIDGEFYIATCSSFGRHGFE